MKKKLLWLLILLGVGLLMGAVIFAGLRWKVIWQPAEFEESSDYLENRERGFYNMRGVRISDESPVEEPVWNSIREEQNEETLELLQIHIGDYLDREISPSGLEQIRNTFQAYREKTKPVSLIVRVLYDWDGKGMESDPASLEIVLRHMEQMGEILEEYADQIYIVQGVFVGSWAEMHSSRYLTEETYLTLIDKMHRTVPRTAYLAVRTPSYWRMAAGRKEPLSRQEAWDMSRLSSRLSLFNDGILGNSLDCGTYGDREKESSVSLTDRWTREDEMDFQNQLNLYVPNGGEVVLDNEWNDLENADEALNVMHISYINKGHDINVMKKWENTIYRKDGSVYDGISGLDYIERHFGYRFVIREADVKNTGWKWEKGSVSIKLENVGYAPRYTPCKAELIFRERESGESFTVEADTDVRDWKPGEMISFHTSFDLEKDGTYEVYLKITGVRDRTAVLFANEQIVQEDGSCFLGTVKKGE